MELGTRVMELGTCVRELGSRIGLGPRLKVSF